MALTRADVYSPQVAGLATVLGSGLAPLRILQQEGYRRAREAAAKAKAQADLEKQFTPPTPDTDGGELFAPEVAESAKKVLSDSQQDYNDAVAGKITVNDARTRVAARTAAHNVMAKRAKEQDMAAADFRNKAAANNLDPSKVGAYLTTLATDPTTGQRMKSANFDIGKISQGVTNGDLLDKAGVVQSFLKGLAGKQENDYATAARLGGTGVTRSASSNIFASDDKGRTIYTLDSRGQRVPKIANIQALEQAALQDPQMAALLRNQMQAGQVPTASTLMGIGGEHVTDDQLEALNAQTDQNTPHERQTLADLIRPYGTLVQKERETYKAPWRPRAASSTAQAGFVKPQAQQLIETNYNALTPGGGVTPISPLDAPAGNRVGYFPGQPIDQTHSAAVGDFPAPLFQEKSGKKIPIKQEDFTPDEYWQNDANGKQTRVQHNTLPLSGIHGTSKGVAVDVKTGEILHPKTKEEREQLIASGKADLRQAISFNTDKNERFSADKTRLLKDLLAKRDTNDEPKYTPAEAEAKAEEMASKGVARITHLYNDKIAAELNTKTGGAYAAYEAQLRAEQARLRAAYKGQGQNATNPGGGIYKRPAATKSATAAPASRGGGIYKIR